MEKKIKTALWLIGIGLVAALAIVFSGDTLSLILEDEYRCIDDSVCTEQGFTFYKIDAKGCNEFKKTQTNCVNFANHGKHSNYWCQQRGYEFMDYRAGSSNPMYCCNQPTITYCGGAQLIENQCDYAPGDVIYPQTFRSGEEISLSSTELPAKAFCRAIPALVIRSGQSSQSTEIYQQIVDGQAVTSDADVTIFYVVSATNIVDTGEIDDRIKALNLSLKEKIDIIDRLTKDISDIDQQITEQAHLIEQLSSKADEQASIIKELQKEISNQALIISRMELTVQQQETLIVKLSNKIDEQAEIITVLTDKVDEQATFIEQLTFNIQEQAILIDKLQENLAGKTALINLLQSENEKQASLIAEMKLSFKEQGEIIDQLNKTINDDVEIISLLTEETKEQAQIIDGMEKTIEEQAELVRELKVKNIEMAELISELELTNEELSRLVQQLELSNEDLKEVISNLEKNRADMEEIIETLSYNNQQLQKELEDAYSTLQRRESTLIYIVGGLFLLVIFFIFAPKKLFKK